MGLLDDYSGEGGILGIGMSPRPTKKHQKIIWQLILGLVNEDIFALSEQCVDENDLNSKAPDVVIYRNKEDTFPIVIIEITTRNMLKKIIIEVNHLMKKYSMIEEAFIYDYEKNHWYCYGKELDKQEPSYSPLLDVDFADFIELD